MTTPPGFAVAALLAVGSPAIAGDGVLREERFSLEAPAEVVAVMTASCRGCSWGAAGQEAAVLRLWLDDHYSQHLYLTRGDEDAAYRVALGAVSRGAHRLRVELDHGASAGGIGTVEVKSIATEAIAEGDAAHRLLAHAPVLHARPDTVGRFTDVPLVMWVESEPASAGTRLRYSVVFSNEDGGTPADRLLATWGRLTDIEYVYGVTLDGAGRMVADEYQGKDHQIRPFAGGREAGHPLLYVVTDNNMVSDRGTSPVRFAPPPVVFDLAGVSREAVMDAHAWTYRISSEEARREGRVDKAARPGSGRIPDPRRFAYLEACALTRDATLAFGVGVLGRDGGTQWQDSSAGLPEFRIVRSPDHFPNGCFRGAVALPPGTTAQDLKALRLQAFTRIARKGEEPLPRGAASARLTRVNRLFLLDGDDRPGPSVLSWSGDVVLVPDGAAYELKVGPQP